MDLFTADIFGKTVAQTGVNNGANVGSAPPWTNRFKVLLSEC